MSPIRLSPTSGVPIYRQIVDQVKFLIEAGQLGTGDRLPSSRMLASNLGVNRNTVAAAYSELRDQGFVRSRGRSGMVVTRAEEVRARAQTRERALEILREAIYECLRLGLSAEEISSLAYHYAVSAEQVDVEIRFIECNTERAGYFANELSERLGTPVKACVLGELVPHETFEVDLVLTTFFHLHEVRQLAYQHSAEVVAIVAAPHVRTLVRIAQIPNDQRVAILYTTQEQADTIRDSLAQAGFDQVEALTGESDSRLADMDVVIVPSEMPQIRERLQGRVEVIEFGNVLDEASVRMVRQVVEDIRDRKVLSGIVRHGNAVNAALPMRQPVDGSLAGLGRGSDRSAA